MRKLLLTTAIVSALVAVPMVPARADFPVIDFTSIFQELQSYWQELQSYVTQLQQLAQELQTATQMVTMVTNFVANPSYAAAMGLMGMVGLNLDLPINPYVVQSLLSGWGGATSIGGLSGKLSGLGGLVNTSYGNNHIYTCSDNSFACAQSQQNGWSAAGHLGVLSQLYQSITDHNAVLNGLRTDMNTASPANREGVIGQAAIENAWHTGVAAQIDAVNGMAQAQQRINAQQADEKWRQDSEAFLKSVPP
jgi:hypothetical protein